MCMYIYCLHSHVHTHVYACVCCSRSRWTVSTDVNILPNSDTTKNRATPKESCIRTENKWLKKKPKKNYKKKETLEFISPGKRPQLLHLHHYEGKTSGYPLTALDNAFRVHPMKFKEVTNKGAQAPTKQVFPPENSMSHHNVGSGEQFASSRCPLMFKLKYVSCP